MLLVVAAGLAFSGFQPITYTITSFNTLKTIEQIKLDIDQQNANVKLVGFADYPTLGPTHSELNGKKIVKLFKNIKSFFPKSL